MKFELMPQDWYKRREKFLGEPAITNIEVIDFNKVENSRCKMIVSYDDNTKIELGAWIQYTNKWTVHGINEKGVSVLARLVE